MTVADVQPYFTLAGGAATLLAVLLSLYITGKRAADDRARAAAAKAAETARAQVATIAQFLGLSRVLRERLSFAYLAAARPIEGFAAFERWLDLAYSAPIAVIVADGTNGDEFFTLLGAWERAYGSMMYSLERLRIQHLSAIELEERRQNVIEAATAAAMTLDIIRRLFGDSSEIADAPLTASELAPSVRRQRGVEAYHDSMLRSIAEPQASLDKIQARALVESAMLEVDPNIDKRCGLRVEQRGQRFDVHIIHAGPLADELDTTIRLRFGEHIGTLRIDR